MDHAAHNIHKQQKLDGKQEEKKQKTTPANTKALINV